MRGYFGIGAERISKAMNLGAVLRTAHAFGASFAFTVGAHHRAHEIHLSDTARSGAHLPFYEWERLSDLRLPNGCALIGVELDERAIELPRFRHPLQAAYILGPEKGDLSEEARALCTALVKIPTRFCVNLSVAAALVMYDRLIALSGAGPRIARPGAPPEEQQWTQPKRTK